MGRKRTTSLRLGSATTVAGSGACAVPHGATTTAPPAGRCACCLLPAHQSLGRRDGDTAGINPNVITELPPSRMWRCSSSTGKCRSRPAQPVKLPWCGHDGDLEEEEVLLLGNDGSEGVGAPAEQVMHRCNPSKLLVPGMLWSLWS